MSLSPPSPGKDKALNISLIIERANFEQSGDAKPRSQSFKGRSGYRNQNMVTRLFTHRLTNRPKKNTGI
jgi:hypothetical protein